MLNIIYSILRITSIIFVVIKQAALFLCKIGIKTRGELVAKTFAELGPIFVKFGQFLSTRPDLIGAKMAYDLAMLRDKMNKFSFAHVRAIILAELGGDIDKFYLEFDQEPVAAASVAQVHKATTMDGEIVAVKILRPNIAKLFARDIALFRLIAAVLEFFWPKYKRLKLKIVLDDFAKGVKMELDFRLEAAAADEMRENFLGDDRVIIPKIHWKTTSLSILTIDWVDGIAIEDKEALIASGLNLKQVAANLAITYFNQSYRDGFFHADMHQGNLFVDAKTGAIILIDFGITGRLDKQTRIFVAEILRGFINRDYQHVARIHILAGYVPKNTNLMQFAQACRSIGEPIVGKASGEISIAKLLSQLFKITEDFDMQTQPQLLLLQKTLLVVEGIGTAIDADVNLWQLAEPWIIEWSKKNLGARAKIKDRLHQLAKTLDDIPKIISQMASR